MSVSKIAITMDSELVKRIDQLVQSREFPNRSRAIQQAVEEKLARLDRTRLASECAKLDPAEEGAFADEGLLEEAGEWPEY